MIRQVLVEGRCGVEGNAQVVSQIITQERSKDRLSRRRCSKSDAQDAGFQKSGDGEAQLRYCNSSKIVSVKDASRPDLC